MHHLQSRRLDLAKNMKDLATLLLQEERGATSLEKYPKYWTMSCLGSFIISLSLLYYISLQYKQYDTLYLCDSFYLFKFLSLYIVLSYVTISIYSSFYDCSSFLLSAALILFDIFPSPCMKGRFSFGVSEL